MTKETSVVAGERTQFTAGPWRYSGSDSVQDECHISCHKGILAATTGATEEDRANAHLIAAAPDLLDACIGLLALVTMHVPNNSVQVQEAIRAISKTEGK